MEHARPQSALMTGPALATTLMGSVRGYEQFLRQYGGMALVRKSQGDEVPADELPHIPTAMADRMFKIAADAVATLRIWQRTKVVYDVDPTFMTELVETEEDVKFPARILRRLPHPNPMFVFPEPFRIHHGGETTLVRGFYTVGRHASLAMASTVEVEDGWIETMAYAETVDDRGAVVNIHRFILPVPLSTGDLSVSDLVAETVKGVDRETVDAADDRHFTTRLATLIVTSLLYVCSDKPEIDVQKTPGRRPSKGRKKAADRPVTIARVGWRLGKAISEFYERIERLKDLGGVGPALRPHIRRGHPHTYRVGVGRWDRIVKWLAPMLVNADDFGELAEGIVIPIE
ncbi:hypothetical protein [Streptomyces sp. BH105]|uniref:hypothetical protein n=1 Tax=Streptomyces sp. BH105 TaxID=3410408 RepID=UPI003CFA5D22